MMSLYRAIDAYELADLRQRRCLAQGPNSNEGKHLTESHHYAVEFGRLLHGEGKFTVISVEFPDVVAANMFQTDKTDGVGPMRFATLDDLQHAIVKQIP